MSFESTESTSITKPSSASEPDDPMDFFLDFFDAGAMEDDCMDSISEDESVMVLISTDVSGSLRDSDNWSNKSASSSPHICLNFVLGLPCVENSNSSAFPLMD